MCVNSWFHIFSSGIVSINVQCINLGNLWATDVQCTRNITLACLRLSVIYQHQFNIQCGYLVFSELEILYLRVAARLFVNLLSFMIYFVYTRKGSNFDELGIGYWQVICVVSNIFGLVCLKGRWCIVSTMLVHINYAIYFHLTYAPIALVLIALRFTYTTFTFTQIKRLQCK